jgi:hypothetical protein
MPVHPIDPSHLPPVYDDANPAGPDCEARLRELLARLRAVHDTPATPMTRLAWLDAVLRENRS